MFKSCKRYGDGECFAGEDLFKRDGDDDEVEDIISERWDECGRSSLPFLIIYFPVVVLLATPQLMIVGGLVWTNNCRKSGLVLHLGRQNIMRTSAPSVTKV